MPVLLENATVLDNLSYAVTAPLDVELDGLEVHRRQNITRVRVNTLSFDLPWAHAREAAGGLSVKSLHLFES